MPARKTKAASSASASELSQQIIEAAAPLFAAHGVEGLSIREISRRAGVSVPALYYHFASKEDLYRKVFAYKIEKTISIIDRDIRNITDLHQRFSAMIESYFNLFTRDKVLYLLVQRDITNAVVNQDIQLSRQQFNHFMQLIDDIVSQILGSDKDPQMSFSIGALILGYCEMTTINHDLYGPRARDFLDECRASLISAANRLLGI